MTREQAINYLISHGITEYRVSEIVRALTYKPRDCANCKHYIVKDTRTNWGSQETTKIYGCERWECEYEPTTKNDLGVDCIDRTELLKAMDTWDKFGYSARYGLERLDKDDKGFVPYVKYDDMVNCVKNMPSVTPQEPRKGHWIADVDKWGDVVTTVNGYRCDKCNAFNSDKDNYCPNCGADMREVEE